ncbi:MAG: cold-shock protein [Phycisphaerales bacterium]
MTTEQDLKDCQGIVKWFDPKKGFGFIIGPDHQDIFIHFSKITGDGFRILRDGASVVYDAVLTDKGWHATRVDRDPADLGAAVQVPRRGYARTPRR